ncbi:hypothetical protein ABPG72_020807 [Tetrahymena utriculariae]
MNSLVSVHSTKSYQLFQTQNLFLKVQTVVVKVHVINRIQNISTNPNTNVIMVIVMNLIVINLLIMYFNSVAILLKLSVLNTKKVNKNVMNQQQLRTKYVGMMLKQNALNLITKKKCQKQNFLMNFMRKIKNVSQSQCGKYLICGHICKQSCKNNVMKQLHRINIAATNTRVNVENILHINVMKQLIFYLMCVDTQLKLSVLNSKKVI